MFSYSYLTRKQANIVYAAWKQGRIDMSKKDIDAIYGVVGLQWRDDKESLVIWKASEIVRWLVEGEDEFAQAVADGKRVVERYEERVRIAGEDDWFDEPGDEIRETVFAGYEIVE